MTIRKNNTVLHTQNSERFAKATIESLSQEHNKGAKYNTMTTQIGFKLNITSRKNRNCGTTNERHFQKTTTISEV